MSELRSDLMILRSLNVLGQILLLAYREKSVAVNAYQNALMLPRAFSTPPLPRPTLLLFTESLR